MLPLSIFYAFPVVILLPVSYRLLHTIRLMCAQFTGKPKVPSQLSDGQLHIDHQQHCRIAIILGGDLERELKAIRKASEHHISFDFVIVSSGTQWTTKEYEEQIVQWFYYSDIYNGIELPAALSALSKVKIDRQAVDTLTNFTTLIPILCKKNRQRNTVCTIYTDQFHMCRALAIGRIILGSIGIVIENAIIVDVANFSERAESRVRFVRDILRSYVWVFTGFTGEAVTKYIHPSRM
mmetsp:Transcript_41950/g.50318  ORF Transcript_41950/g.50318 Transcript_41950/m.50318 type:complete len:237 (-) Transcript_41950:201-911(-)